MKKEYNQEKVVFGKLLGEQLIALGFIPTCVNKHRDNPNENVYHFTNSFLLRNMIRKILRENVQ